MNTSLTKFCKDAGLAKSTVYDRCRELGFDTSNGLTGEQCDRLRHEFDVVTAPSMASVQVDLGNHREETSLSVPGQFNLETFRSDRVRHALANPSEFIAGIDAMVDGLTAAMDAAEHQQETELLNTRHVKRVAAQRLDTIKRRSETYRLKSDLVAMFQNDELEEVSAIASELQNMQGKSPDGQ